MSEGERGRARVREDEGGRGRTMKGGVGRESEGKRRKREG